MPESPSLRHPPTPTPALRRELGVFSAVMLGLGSIIGTGVFVSLGIAAGVAGPGVILAVVLAAGVATCNALSSAQLAASHPVSGGTYEYGYLYLRPWLGFTAGWMFLCAKSASAATAALGFVGYLLNLLPGDAITPSLRILLAAGVVVLFTGIVLTGLKRSNAVNTLIVGVTVLALLTLAALGLPAVLRDGAARLTNFTAAADGKPFLPALLHATALMFVAYTGYGRIATLGEEVREPRRTIPRAIITTLWFTAGLYVLVALTAVGVVGAEELGTLTAAQAAPLEAVARQLALPGLPLLIAIGAMTAMLGVLLNLILGLSRVALAMGRRGDLPACFGAVAADSSNPRAAVLLVGVLVTGLTLLGSVKTTWSFSAFTVLIYYALTNLAALRLPPEQRLYPRVFAWLGLASCLLLAFWVEWRVWLVGCGLIALGWLWHQIAQRCRRR